MMLRYDRYSDELLWLRQTDFRTGMINKSVVAGFEFSDEEGQLTRTFVKKEIRRPGMGSFDAYLQILVEGPVSLYVFRNVVQAVSVSKTVDNTLYFLHTGSGWYPVAMRRRSLLKTPGIDIDLMKNIIRSNRLSFHNDESDFTKAVYLYNESLE